MAIAAITRPERALSAGPRRFGSLPWRRVAPRIVVSPSARERLEIAGAWLAERAADRDLVVLGATLEAASAAIARTAAADPSRARFGFRATTPARLAVNLAGPALAMRGIVVSGPLVLEALCARVIHALSPHGEEPSGLGRFGAIADRPGLVRAIARTVLEIRLAGIDADALAAVDPELAPILRAYEDALATAGLGDRASVLSAAIEIARGAPAGHDPHLAVPVLLLDAPISSALEGELVAALTTRASEALAVVPAGDRRTLRQLASTFPGCAIEQTEGERTEGERTEGERTEGERTEGERTEGALGRLQRHLFEPAAPPRDELDDGVVVVSAPGEAREAVEIARRIQGAVDRGIAFDRIAVLARAPTVYRAHLEEAFRRAAIPAHFAQGTRRPDPAGRAFLALLGCAAEGLSARRFAEYLSLGQVPDTPASPSHAPGWVPSDDELLPSRLTAAPAPTPAADDDASVPAPRRWERLLVEASVIGGRDRWARRLAGLRSERELDLRALDDPDPDSPRAIAIRRSIADLEALAGFALPLLAALDDLPELATWAVWLEALAAIAARALRAPERVLAVLSELSPMGPIGPVSLHEVRLVLGTRLRELVVAPETSPAGRVFVGAIDLARGLAFDLVFVPGLAEKVFPQKVVEDPILRDEQRARLAPLARLDTNEDRIAEERLALRLAVGAARRQVVLSWPRVDLDHGRPRVPSFYGLEVLRAAEGALAGFDELGLRAEEAARREGAAATRLGWPAPVRPIDAIDEAEHDLALLAPLLDSRSRPNAKGVTEDRGAARYLLDANPHLARALRARARRFIARWTPADGLVDPPDEVRAALAKHLPNVRSFSPTALQHYAACPYRFLLQAIHRLAPREIPEAIEELDPLQRGSLVHEVLYELHVRLRAEGRLPLGPSHHAFARDLLDQVVDEVAARWHDELAPAIERVWEAGIAAIRADVREWLARAVDPAPTEREAAYEPWKFELSFGLVERRAQDPASTREPVTLASGLRLRGSIDLVERRGDGLLRATDYKTGKARAKRDAVIGGGEHLQPILYALALEALFPGSKVEGGRLYYCTAAGGYERIDFPLDDYARTAIADVVSIVGEAIATGFLPAAPTERACEYCDYRPVCGPDEERRIRLKNPARLVRLRTLRSMP
jgi:RecB family exonuclease